MLRRDNQGVKHSGHAENCRFSSVTYRKQQMPTAPDWGGRSLIGHGDCCRFYQVQFGMARCHVVIPRLAINGQLRLASIHDLPMPEYPFMKELTVRDRCRGVMLGTAVGDSIGLPAEGISRQRAKKLFRGRWRHRLVINRGMVSDDTDHSVFVAQSLLVYPNSPDRFAKRLSWCLRWWLLSGPASVGFRNAEVYPSSVAGRELRPQRCLLGRQWVCHPVGAHRSILCRFTRSNRWDC